MHTVVVIITTGLVLPEGVAALPSPFFIGDGISFVDADKRDEGLILSIHNVRWLSVRTSDTCSAHRGSSLWGLLPKFSASCLNCRCWGQQSKGYEPSLGCVEAKAAGKDIVN